MGGAESSKPSSHSSLPDVGALVAEKYRVEQLVGQGGMGVVLAARHVQLGQSVALKLIRPEVATTDEVIRRFLREARAVASLESDHVVRIYDVGTLEDGAPFMVMELLKGVDLGTVLDERGTLDVELAVDYLLQASAAVESAHAHGIVHRDLKPSNLFVTRRSDGTPLVKVLDFGISKAIDPDGHGPVDLTSTSALIGSPQYMAPEQVRNARSVDSRADIWALGVLLHEMLAGAPPFVADSVSGMCAAIAADPPARVRDTRPGVPEGVEAIILRCLEKDPARRFQNVGELADALRPFAPQRLASSPSNPVPKLESGRDATLRSNLEVQPTLAYDSAKILISGSHPTGPAALLQSSPALTASRTTTAPSRRRTLLAGGAVAAVLFVAVSWFVLRTPGPAPAPVLAASTARPAFKLALDSTPSGADLYDGDRKLGTTPLELSLTNAALGQAPRRITFRRDGYVEYTLVQGPSQVDVRVVASLVPEPPAPPEAPPAASAAEAPSTHPSALSHHAWHAAPAKPKPSSAAPPDIRMHR